MGEELGDGQWALIERCYPVENAEADLGATAAVL